MLYSCWIRYKYPVMCLWSHRDVCISCRSWLFSVWDMLDCFCHLNGWNNCIFKHCHEDVTVSHILSLSASLYSRLSAVSGLCVCFGQKNSMIIFGGKCRDGHCSRNGLLCAASCCTAGTSCLAISQLAEYIGYRWSWLFKYITHKVLEVYGLSSVILRARNLLLFFFRSAILFLWQLESLWALLVELNNKVAQGWCGCPIPRGI